MNQPENTIPFSIEKWKEGYEVVCRDGAVPSELHYFETAKQCFALAGITDGELNTWSKRGKVLIASTHRCDLFLRPKLEKWYRRAYWHPDEIVPQYAQSKTYLTHLFFGNRFDESPGYKWAGPIEEFEVRAREG